MELLQQLFSGGRKLLDHEPVFGQRELTEGAAPAFNTE
jgi:hypothetical protein